MGKTPAAPVDNDQLLANRLVKHMQANNAPLAGWEWRLSCVRANPKHYTRQCLIKALRADALGTSGRKSLTNDILGLVATRLIREAMDGLPSAEAMDNLNATLYPHGEDTGGASGTRKPGQQ